MLELTEIFGTPGTGSNHASFCEGPSYAICTMQVTVPSAFFEKMISSLVWSTGAACEHQNPPHASAGGAVQSAAISVSAAAESENNRRSTSEAMLFMIGPPSYAGPQCEHVA